MRERELKPGEAGSRSVIVESLPMRERELKLEDNLRRAGNVGRSPCGSVN